MPSNTIRRILSVFAVSIALLVTVGCGSSNNDFVANNTGGQNVNAGNLVFLFQRAVAQTTVEADTTSLRFDFHTANPPTATSLSFTEDRLFAERIVFTDVPTDIVFVNVSELNDNGGLINRFSTPVAVSSNSEVVVDLGNAEEIVLESIQVNPDPAVIITNGFFDGASLQLEILGSVGGSQVSLAIDQQTTTFQTDNPAFTVSNTGALQINPLFEEVGLNATGTATYTLNGSTFQDTFDIEAFFFGFGFFFGSDFTFPVPNDFSEQLIATDNHMGNNAPPFFLARPNGTQQEVFADDMTLGLVSPVTGVSISPAGVLTVGASVPLGTQFGVVCTFIDNGPNGSGRTFTTTLNFIVSDQGGPLFEIF